MATRCECEEASRQTAATKNLNTLKHLLLELPLDLFNKTY